MSKVFLRLIVLAAFVFCSVSCSSIRMRYDANVVAEDGRTGKVEFEKSYDVGSFPVLCAVTGIFFGGACWYYVVMPTTYQQLAVEKDARAKLEETFAQTPFELRTTSVASSGWKDEAERFAFVPAAGGPPKGCADLANIEKLIADERAEEQPDLKLIQKLEKKLESRRKGLGAGQKCD